MVLDRFLAKTLTKLMLAAPGLLLMGAAAIAQPLPAGGRPGCYAKLAYPPTYKTVIDRVAAPPVVSYRDIPAVIEHAIHRVLVTPARVEHQSIAPVYRTASRWIEVPGPMREVTSQPVYRTITERRLIAPAHLVWRPGGAAHGYSASGGYGDDGALRVHPTGEVLCRVLAPARYSVVRRRVLVAPGRITTVQGPPRPVRVQDHVLVQPGRVIDQVIPAVYRTEDAVRVVRPASRQRIVTPGAVRLISRRVQVSPAHFGWAPIVCTPQPGGRSHAPAQPAPAPAYGAPAYGPPAPPPPQSYGAAGGYGSTPVRPAGHAYRPDELLAPTPTFSSPQNLVPAPYDVGHPARR